MKKLTAIVLSLAVVLAHAPFAVADDAGEEAIHYSVNFLSERLYNKLAKDCYPLDISRQCNMGYADETAGDGVGGWSDQGSSNDIANFDLRGTNYILNIPFNFIEPKNNGGKSTIMLRGQNDAHFPLQAEIPVNDTAEGMYIIHGAAWGSNGNGVGKYGFVYEDGTSAMFEIVCGTHIADFWGTRTSSYMRTAWVGSNPSSSTISLNLFALNNPHPEKKIKSVRLLAYGNYTYMGVVAVTMVRSGLSLPMDVSASSNTLSPASAGLWAKAEPAEEAEFEGSIMDSSKYLDAPAGKHGLIKADGEKLIFEDGTKAKLWGTNIAGEACFPQKETAEDMASRIARCGYSLVRFINIDGKELTDERLDRLAYFQSLLKEKGIYTYFSLLGIAPGDGDDIETGWKTEGLFDGELIKKQQEFAQRLLTYKNPYTGETFAGDKSVAFIDLADQNSMFDFRLGDGTFTLKTEKYKKLITEKFNEFLKEKYKTTSALKKRWKLLYDDESIEDGTININGNWKYGLYADDVRRADVYEFLGKIQQDYFDALADTVRKTGYKGLISGVTNNWNNITPYNSYSVSKYADFLPLNAVGANGYEHNLLENDLWYVDFDSIVCGDQYDGGEFMEIAENRVSGVPYVISEWGAGVLSPTFYETPVVMSVLAAQQGWTPVQYCFVYNQISKDSYQDLYSTYQNPVLLSLAQLSASLFYNTDELEKETEINFNTSYLYNDKNLNNGITPNIHKEYKTPGFTAYYGKKSSVSFTSGKTAQKAAGEGYITENDGLHFDMMSGKFYAKNSKTIAFAGKTSQIEKYGRLAFDSYSAYFFTGLISADGNDIESSERMLFTIGARTLNSDMEIDTVTVDNAGGAPIIYDAVIADITIDNAAGYKVYALDGAGQRIKQLDTSDNADGSLSFTANNYVSALNYEIVKED